MLGVLESPALHEQPGHDRKEPPMNHTIPARLLRRLAQWAGLHLLNYEEDL